MFRLFVAAVIVVPVLLLGSSSIVMASSGDDDFGNRTKRHDMIWEGLCVGASLDLSFESQVSCAKQARSAPPPQTAPPNIGAGLCVGASLDLSPASQASCKRQSPASQTSQPVQKLHPAPTAQAPAPVEPVQYAALGDSIAAGAGLATASDGQKRCGRTTEAYPYTVAEKRGQTLTHLACRGATTRNLSTQLSEAFTGGTPEFITITIGANDIRWDTFLRKCYTGTCGSERDDRVASRLLLKLDEKLQHLLQDVEQRSGGSPPQVVITGYYDPLSENCAGVEPRVTLEEVTWLSAQTDELNLTLQSVSAQYNFVTFAPIDFTGHDLCSGDPWVQTLDDPAPFHPTPTGQLAIAQAVL